MTSEPPRRPHPAAIVVEAASAALRLLGTIVIVGLAGAGTRASAAALAAAGIAASAAIGWVAWRRTTYWLDDAALHHRSGVFTPDLKIVPRARVQAVDTETGPLQRLFGVVELRVQVPGAADADEIVLPAVTHEEAARLRRALGQPEPAEPDERVRLGMRQLLVAALTGPQISVAMSAVAGVYALLDDVVDVSTGESLIARLDTAGEILAACAIVLGAVSRGRGDIGFGGRRSTLTSSRRTSTC